MTKAEAIYSFWSSFGLPTYEETTVPAGEMPQFPYLTYSSSMDNIDNDVSLSCSLWYYGTSWKDIEQKTTEIAKKLYNIRPIKVDGGYLWLKRGSPFAQRMDDPTDFKIRRMYINISGEFLTAF